jgi:hypothetical protein
MSPEIVGRLPEGRTEWVLYRRGFNDLALARLERTGYGWRLQAKSAITFPGRERMELPGTAAHLAVEPLPDSSRSLIWGELFAPEADALRIGDERISLSGSGHLLLLPVTGAVSPDQLELLDRQGQPLFVKEVTP